MRGDTDGYIRRALEHRSSRKKTDDFVRGVLAGGPTRPDKLEEQAKHSKVDLGDLEVLFVRLRLVAKRDRERITRWSLPKD